MSKVMNASTKLDKQINDYLVQLNNKQKKAVLLIVKTFADEQESDVWKDKEFIAELNRRAAEYESGKVKMLTLDELESSVRELIRKNKVKAM